MFLRIHLTYLNIHIHDNALVTFLISDQTQEILETIHRPALLRTTVTCRVTQVTLPETLTTHSVDTGVLNSSGATEKMTTETATESAEMWRVTNTVVIRGNQATVTHLLTNTILLTILDITQVENFSRHLPLKY